MSVYGEYVRGRTGACGAVYVLGHTWADVVLGDVLTVYMGYMGVVGRCWVVFLFRVGFCPIWICVPAPCRFVPGCARVDCRLRVPGPGG